MAVLIDPPAWPAHGTVWSHLVSDVSYDELHAFAARLGIPRRGFDLDHYDVPTSLYGRAIELGARAVTAKDVVHALRSTGLRVRGVDREAMRPVRRRQYLEGEWASLGQALELDRDEAGAAEWESLGAGLLERWNEPHRKYHNERHLEDVLLALNQLSTRGERIEVETLLAAWFHDAIYTGHGGRDEEDSAQLAVASLERFSLAGGSAQRVGEFIVDTTPARPIENASPALVHLLDADLAIFASPRWRYEEYTVAVREEVVHVPDADFARGRAQILEAYLVRPAVYRGEAALVLWEQRARANLRSEIRLLSGAPSPNHRRE